MPTPEIERNLALDMTRFFGILAVIMIHASAPFASLFDSSVECFYGNFFDSLAKIANPLFVMTSGALLLDERRKMTIRSLFAKNIRNIVTLIVFWGVVFAIVYHALIPSLNGEMFSVVRVFLAMRGHWHMWFLYMILGLYLSTPFLRSFTNNQPNNELPLLFIIIALCTVFMLPVVQALSYKSSMGNLFEELIKKHLYIQFFGGYAAYYLSGWYIVHVGIAKKSSRVALYALGALAAITVVAFTWNTKCRALYQNLGLPVFFMSVATFLFVHTTVRKYREKIGKRLERWIINLSKLSFGVYIIHPFLLTAVDYLMPYKTSGLHPAAYMIFYFLCVTFFAYLASFVMSKIPVLKGMVRA